MTPSPTIKALALLLLVTPHAMAESTDTLFYDLQPFAQSDPELHKSFEALQEPDGQHSQLKEALEAKSTSERWKDPHTKRAAYWLVARALIEKGELDEASPFLEELDLHRSSLIDTLIPPLNTRLRKAQREAEAAQWAFAHVHTGQGMRESCTKAVAYHQASKSEGLGLQRLKTLLNTTLSLRTRRALTLLAAELELRSGAKEAALTRLRRLWWETTSKEVRAKVEKKLKSQGASKKTLELEAIVELAFKTRTRDMKSVRRGLKRQSRRTKNRTKKRLLIWARALIAGLDKAKREESERVVATYTKKLRGTPIEAWTLLGHAKALRRLNRDVEAAQVYEDMATRFPHHPRRAHALNEAAGLLMAKGYPTEADALYRKVLTLKEHGEPEREALWQVGFGAFLRGNYAESSQVLQRLNKTYSSQREGLGVSWNERSHYWWARAEGALNHKEEAARLYRELVWRFPAGWYAILARERLKELGSTLPLTHSKPELEHLQILRHPTLDYAVALIKFGALKEAQTQLKALWNSGQLPGSGRRLLATLYTMDGEDSKASSLLRRHGILAELPNPSNAKAYTEAFPYKYAKHIEHYANQAGISAAWFAGLIFVESRFNPKAQSGAGAIGLAQLMPKTAQRTSKRVFNKSVSSRALRRPKTNLSIGAALLRRLLNRFRNNSILALAAYNAGSGAATAWLRKRGHLPSDAFVETIPYDQTRRYVMRVSALAKIYHRLYGVPGPLYPVIEKLPLTLGEFDGSTASDETTLSPMTQEEP